MDFFDRIDFAFRRLNRHFDLGEGSPKTLRREVLFQGALCVPLLRVMQTQHHYSTLP